MIWKKVMGGIALAAVIALPLVLGTVASSESGKESGWAKGKKSTDETEGIEYPGVDPEKKTGIAPLILKAKKSKKTVVTWPGFQMVHGGSRVFVQMLQGTSVEGVTGPSRVQKPPFKVTQPSLVYVFSKKVVLIKNNLNPLITRAFNTPVNKVRMKRKKGKVYMVLELRSNEEPVREELIHTEEGYHFFFVEFASGEFLPKPKTEAKKIVE
ncbi:MAG: hypothetical protein JRG91_19330 [Deltaproteobacteria bacterium]|nr:hypothetical protein [Deltaproteobacteria bacterium]